MELDAAAGCPWDRFSVPAFAEATCWPSKTRSCNLLRPFVSDENFARGDDDKAMAFDGEDEHCRQQM